MSGTLMTSYDMPFLKCALTSGKTIRENLGCSTCFVFHVLCCSSIPYIAIKNKNPKVDPRRRLISNGIHHTATARYMESGENNYLLTLQIS